MLREKGGKYIVAFHFSNTIAVFNMYMDRAHRSVQNIPF